MGHHLSKVNSKCDKLFQFWHESARPKIIMQTSSQNSTEFFFIAKFNLVIGNQFAVYF